MSAGKGPQTNSGAYCPAVGSWTIMKRDLYIETAAGNAPLSSRTHAAGKHHSSESVRCDLSQRLKGI